ncbi:pentapeptide repeat-containing protein [Actinopolymorpha sp. B11F2]|uniref:pentapeptide repeat-containing protein n=1 Tax=Actinopolymorpha sp. B11F2 TaxID=3160862 RepID=UPI0032E37861
MPPPRKPRPPTKPRMASPPVAADLALHDIADDAHLQGLAFTGVRMPDRDARLVDVEECEFTQADLSGCTLAKATFADCRFVSSNLANLGATSSSLIRCELRGLRTTGFRWIDGTLRDVVFSECRLDLTAFRFTSLMNVRFVGCNLRQTDFTNADVRGAAFIDCDLTAAQFSHADMRGTRLQNCVLDGISSVTSLRGAVIDPQDLIALTYALANALGIVIETPDDHRRGAHDS